MSRFRGNYSYTIDEKGRLNVPAKWRKLLTAEAQETFVISRAPDGCLWAYPQDEWETFEQRLNAMVPGRESNLFQRTIQSTLADSTLDKQGRVTLSPLQVQVAGITKEITLVGRGSYIEIWDSERLRKYLGSGDTFDDVYYAAMEKLAAQKQ
jgi:MraZ protein